MVNEGANSFGHKLKWENVDWVDLKVQNQKANKNSRMEWVAAEAGGAPWGTGMIFKTMALCSPVILGNETGDIIPVTNQWILRLWTIGGALDTCWLQSSLFKACRTWSQTSTIILLLIFPVHVDWSSVLEK